MVLGSGSSSQLTSFTDADPLFTFPQVCVHSPSSAFKFRPLRIVSHGQAAAASAVGSAPLRRKNESVKDPNLSQKPISESPFRHRRRGLQALNELLPAQPRGAESRSYPQNECPKQALQKLRETSPSQAEVKQKKSVGSDQWRNPLFLDPPPHFHQGDNTSHAAGLVSSPVKETASNATNRKRMQPTKRWSSKHSSRGFDVLDDLMSSQGRNSKAVLESLQAEVALETDKTCSRDSAADAQTRSYVGDNVTPRATYGGFISQMYTESGRLSIHGDAIDTSSATSAFTSSIGKALSPLGAAIPASASNASTKKTGMAQPSTSSTHREAASDTTQPSLRGQEVLWALQKAALEKAKQKQKNRKRNERVPKSKETSLLHDSGEWRKAKPIVLKHEWALEIDNLEQRIEKLRTFTLSAT